MRNAMAMASILLAALLAGCVDSDGETETGLPPGGEWTAADQVHEPEWAVRALFADDVPTANDRWADHDHHDIEVHRGLSTPNFEITGHDPLRSEEYGGAPAGDYFCGHPSGVREDGRRLAASVSIYTDVAIVVIDITDPDAPFKVGELVMPNYIIYDVDLTEDGQFAVLAATLKASDRADQITPGSNAVVAETERRALATEMYWVDACTGETFDAYAIEDTEDYGDGTLLIDLSDPSFPHVVDFLPDTTRNVHSVSTTNVDGVQFVATSSLLATTTRNLEPEETDVGAPPGPRFGNLLSHFQFATIEEDANGEPTLQAYSTYTSSFYSDPETAVTIAGYHNRHVDATIQKHPMTDQVIAYIANWEGGFATISLDGPGAVTPLDSFYEPETEDSGDEMRGRGHSAVPIAETWTVNGEERHLTIWGQEVIARPTGRPSGEMILTDTTDPANIIPVARWTIPVDIDWGSGDPFSSHYPFMVGETMFIAMYHFGFWAADASPEHWPELPSIGVFMPDGQAPPSHNVRGAPEVLEGFDLGDGRLGVLDANSGYYTVKWTGHHPDVPPTTPWMEDAWIGQE